MDEKLVALSIGSNSISAAVGIENEDGQFELSYTISKLSKGINKGKIVNLELAKEVIINILSEISKENGKIDGVYIALNVNGLVFKRNRGAVLLDSNNTINEEILMNAYKDSKDIEIGEDEIIVDAIIRELYKDGECVKSEFKGLSGVSIEMDVDLVIAKRHDLIDIETLFTQIGCKIKGYILGLEALRKMFRDDNINKEANLLIDFGSEKTEYIFFDDDAIVYKNYIELGGSNITKDLAIVTGNDEQLMEEIKVKYSNTYDDLRKSFSKIETENGNIDAVLFYDVINARLEEVLEYLKKDLETHNIYDKIENITIFGDGIGIFENIATLIENKLGKKPKIFTKNEVNVENSSIIMPIAIVKEVYDRLKLLGKDKIKNTEKVKINILTEEKISNSETEKVKKRGLSKVLGFLGDIF